MTKRLVGVIFVLVLGIGGWLLSGNLVGGQAVGERKPTGSGPNRLTVRVGRAVRVNSAQQLREFTGVIAARRRSDLSFERTGRIIEVTVDDGQKVEKDQLLAKLDVEHAVAQRDAAKASLDQAQAVYDELKAGPRKETLAAAKARVDSFGSIAKRRERDYERSQRLSLSDAVSREQVETSQYEWESAESNHKEAQAQLAELLAGTRTEQLLAQRAKVQVLEAQLQQLELDIEDGELRAPYAGRIAKRLVDEGTVVAPSTVVLELIEDNDLEARIGIPVGTSSQLKLGNQYVLNTYNARVNGELLSLLPALDSQTRTRTGVFRIATSQDDLVPGQIARLELNEQVECNGLELPSTALVAGPRGMWNIYVVNEKSTPKTIERRTVELLYTHGDSSIVTGTVQDGETIVLDGTHRVVHGQEVDIEFMDEEVAER